MTQAILEARSTDERTYDIDCTRLLDTGETITRVLSIADDSGALIFGTPAINTQAVTYPDRTTAPAGKVIQVLISGFPAPGPQGTLYTIRALFSSTKDPQVEATVQLRVINQPN